MKTLTIRTDDELLLERIKNKADKKRQSVNQFVIHVLKQNLGLLENSFTNTYNDLDYLAGTWSLNDEKDFFNNISNLEKIDEEIWK